MANRVVVAVTAICMGTLYGMDAVGAEIPGQAAADPTQPTWVPDELIIGFRDVPSAQDFDALALKVPAARDWRVMNHPRFAKGSKTQVHPLARIRIVEFAVATDVERAARQIALLPGVAYAQPNFYMYPAFTPNDPLFESLQYGPQIIRAEEAWDLTTGDASVIIAVADSGIRFEHEEFQDGAIWMNDDPVNGIDDDGNGFIDDWRGWDFINNDNDPSFSSDHGTHVTGIAAARLNNKIGIAGMGNFTIMPLQVFQGNFGTWEAITDAIYYATDNGANLLNYSGGGGGGTGALADACTYAWEHDVSVVVASGNHGTNASFFPAMYPETIAISGTGPGDIYYTLSGRGPHIDVAAPGIDVWSCFATTNNSYAPLTGTSMATPHVSGLVALMYSLNPNLGVEEVRTLLQENAVDLGPPGFDEMFGWGRIDAKETLDAVGLDDTAPTIVHDSGVSTNPFSGYIDPRMESTDGVNQTLGIDSLVITFTEIVQDVSAGDGALTTISFSITGDGPGVPSIIDIDASENPTVELFLSGPIPVGGWVTIVADVEDSSGNPIPNFGNQGPGVNEPDRVDIGFLSADIDQSGAVEVLDLLRFRGIVAGTFENPEGEDIDYVDTDRNGAIEPLDLLRYRQLLLGVAGSTRVWLGETIGPRP